MKSCGSTFLYCFMWLFFTLILQTRLYVKKRAS